MPEKPRNYAEEYKYHSTPEQKKNRAQRNAARRKLEAAGRVSKGDKKDVHHVKGLKAGNGAKNLRVMSRSKNRSIK